MTYGINEDGWDEFEPLVREEFECWAIRKGYDITIIENTGFYYDSGTEDSWRAYHLGHVRGRDFG